MNHHASHHDLLELQNLSIPQLIARLYQAADMPPPTAARPLVPLHHLVGAQGLKAVELNNLTARAALDDLQQRGTLKETWPQANREPLSAFLYAHSAGGSLAGGCLAGGCVFVRREDPIARRRFCVAHELGHFVLHWPRVWAQAQGASAIELIEMLPPTSNPAADEWSQGRLLVRPEIVPLKETEQETEEREHEREHEADSFAAQLLMPEVIVRALAAPLSHCSDADLARRLSTELLVSRTAMLVRLRHLGLLRGEAALFN